MQPDQDTQPGLIFSPDKLQVFDHIERGRSLMITGPAGSGKSTLLNEINRRYAGDVAITGTTGIAALNVGGCTVHSFAGLKLALEPAEVIAQRIVHERKRAYKNLISTQILAIDEISLMGDDLFSKLDEVCRRVRGSRLPFGGIQLLMFGDFLQLPPIGINGSSASFAFESDSWCRANVQTHLLTQVHRQADQAFVDGLGQLRFGHASAPEAHPILARNGIETPYEGVQPIIIHPRNLFVDQVNGSVLSRILEKEYSYFARDAGEPEHVSKLKQDCLAPDILRLKVGAQVMLLVNLSIDEGLANGSIGVVEELTETTILVNFSGHYHRMEPHLWTLSNKGERLAQREQYPLRLAYALTTHKAQGLTLDSAVCHLDQVDEYGQAYVAVSRVKNLNGLYLRGTTPTSFKAHPSAVSFYRKAIEDTAIEIPSSFDDIEEGDDEE